MWFVVGLKAQPRPGRTISLTVVSNSCNVWSGGGEVAENEVTEICLKLGCKEMRQHVFYFLGFLSMKGGHILQQT